MFGSLFRKKSSITTSVKDFSFLTTDIHNHVLPGIDDGASDLEVSGQLISGLHELGFQKIIATPHILADLYPNSPETIHNAFGTVGNNNGALRYAAEYMLDDQFEKLLADNQLLTMGDKYVLIEMSYLAETRGVWDTIFQLGLRGYRPILAHPERYNYYHPQFDTYRRFKNAGCLLQLNLLSITGYYGPGVKKVAEKLLKEEIIDLAGTDLHHERHLKALQKMPFSKEWPLIANYPFKNKDLFG